MLHVFPMFPCMSKMKMFFKTSGWTCTYWQQCDAPVMMMTYHMIGANVVNLDSFQVSRLLTTTSEMCSSTMGIQYGIMRMNTSITGHLPSILVKKHSVVKMRIFVHRETHYKSCTAKLKCLSLLSSKRNHQCI